jgi:hypothetical protein
MMVVACECLTEGNPTPWRWSAQVRLSRDTEAGIDATRPGLKPLIHTNFEHRTRPTARNPSAQHDEPARATWDQSPPDSQSRKGEACSSPTNHRGGRRRAPSAPLGISQRGKEALHPPSVPHAEPPTKNLSPGCRAPLHGRPLQDTESESV